MWRIYKEEEITMALIDKDALIGKIEERMQELHPTNTHKMQVGEKMDRDVLMWLNALSWVKKVIDTLEVKEVNLEKEVRKFIKDNGTSLEEPDEFLTTLMQLDDMVMFAKHFYELGLNAKI